MKRIVLLLCLITLVSGCATKEKEDAKEETINLELEIVKTEKCENKVTKYYEGDNRKIYFVCLDEVRIANENKTLSYYLNNNEKSLEDSVKDLASNLKETSAFNDGGTKIYRNDKMTIITCNRIQEGKENNQDIYIGNENLEFDIESFCTSSN